MNTTPEQLRAIADIMEGNKPFEVRRFPDHQWQNPGFPIQWYIADNRMQAWEIRPKPLDFAPIPEGSTLHNPDGLTPEQVGEGWRLLTTEELKTFRGECEMYLYAWVAVTCQGADFRTYRVPIETPYPCGSRVVDGKLVKPWKPRFKVGDRVMHEDGTRGTITRVPTEDCDYYLGAWDNGVTTGAKEADLEPAKVQLGPEDWMKDGPWWIRSNASDTRPYLIISVDNSGIYGMGLSMHHTSAMDCERSNDGIIWTPCWKLA